MKVERQITITFDTLEIPDLAYMARMAKARIEDNNRQSTPDKDERATVSLADRIINISKELESK